MNPITDFASEARNWQGFYILTGTAAATLTGLMFLSVTFGARLVTKKTVTAAQAFMTPTALHFVHAFGVSCLMVVPTMTAPVLGWLLVVLGTLRILFLRWVYGVFGKIHKESGTIEWTDWVYHVALPLLSYLLAITTGAGFLYGIDAAFNGLALYVLLITVVGILVAWDLLMWLALKIT